MNHLLAVVLTLVCLMPPAFGADFLIAKSFQIGKHELYSLEYSEGGGHPYAHVGKPTLALRVPAAPAGSTLESVRVEVRREHNAHDDDYLRFFNTSAHAIPTPCSVSVLEQWIVTEDMHRSASNRPLPRDGRCWFMANLQFGTGWSGPEPMQPGDSWSHGFYHYASHQVSHVTFNNAAWTTDLWGAEHDAHGNPLTVVHGGSAVPAHQVWISPRVSISGYGWNDDNLDGKPDMIVAGEYSTDDLVIVTVTVRGRTPAP